MDQNQMMLEYLLEMGALQPEQEKADRMMKQAQMLREQGMQQPGMQAAGRVHVAANPLQFLNTALQSGLGTYGQKQAETGMDVYGQKRREALANLRQRMQAQQPQSQQPGATPGIVPPTGGSPYGDDPYGVRGW